MKSRLYLLSAAACVAAVLAAPPAPPAAPAADEAPFRGRIVETMNSGGYTYVQVDSGTGRLWAACLATVVHTGDVVTVPRGMLMTDFESPTLRRTFARIRFVAGLDGAEGSGKAPALPPGHPILGGTGAVAGAGTAALPAGHPPLGSGTGAAVTVEVKATPPPPGGLAIADVLARRKELAGKDVTVRGTVVKVTRGVMGRNWLHLRDAPGAEHDLTVTTDADAKAGDTVTASGKVAIDRDFGFGYRYDVLVERARLAAP